ncbi:MAG TPA: hypothetical protein VMH04_20810 [Candidatus Solibacter sp.]|nr:hypothetical protein [Candidatus Solibacter sp.]
MSIKRRFRMLFLCLPLLLGAFAGMPMRPEEIEDLIHSTNRQTITHTIPDGEDKDRTLPPLDSLKL